MILHVHPVFENHVFHECIKLHAIHSKRAIHAKKVKRAKRARMPKCKLYYVQTCHRMLHANVPTCQRLLRSNLPLDVMCHHASVPTCQIFLRACLPWHVTRSCANKPNITFPWPQHVMSLPQGHGRRQNFKVYKFHTYYCGKSFFEGTLYNLP